MGWFESQIHERTEHDLEMFDRSMRELASAVTGRDSVAADDAARMTQGALAAILGYYGARPVEVPRNLTDLRDIVEYQLRPTGIAFRTVHLPAGWYKDAVGALLARDADGSPVALLPQARGGYVYVDHASGSKVHVDAKVAESLSDEAWCFYRPLPLTELGVRDILVYMARCLDANDYLYVAVATLAVTLLGLLVPRVSQLVFGHVVAAGDVGIVGAITCLLVGVTIAQLLIGSAKSMVMARVSTKLSVSVQAAVMMRVLSLPVPFFKKYASGDLAMRISSVGTIASMLQSIVLSTGLTSVFSLVYIAQIFSIAPSLTLPALLVILVSCVLGIVTVVMQVGMSRKTLKLQADLAGWQYALFNGIQKIKLAGAERRAFSTWADRYAKLARLTYNGPLALRLSGTVQAFVSSLGTMLLYACTVSSGIGVAQYMAFTSAFGMVSGAFSSLTGAAGQIAMIRPQLELAAPILETVPEVSQGREVLSRISGGFELDNVTFAYDEGSKPVIDGLSLKVRPGQYVAIVGQTGCGKSTLMRLLLGFETPQRGAVYYDGRDLSTLDVSSLRRNIGVVLQDGKLFQGDIYSNIIISAPWLTMDEAWEAAELAGIADDIRAMPMGMHTIVGEGGAGLSGGQRQRLMIARAIAPKPKILMFDEATSALDNVTQRIVCESLDRLKCTRVVIAHRLSTIRTCNRIIVLEGGNIAEDGTYEELMDKGGIFAKLVEHQQV